ncbi:hypothetical protein FACS1894184_19220 [Clostridia bacterium]|nr:hypothetical protein FACS1894184_19220 [Clostridia bacterium]
MRRGYASGTLQAGSALALIVGLLLIVMSMSGLIQSMTQDMVNYIWPLLGAYLVVESISKLALAEELRLINETNRPSGEIQPAKER